MSRCVRILATLALATVLAHVCPVHGASDLEEAMLKWLVDSGGEVSQDLAPVSSLHAAHEASSPSRQRSQSRPFKTGLTCRLMWISGSSVATEAQLPQKTWTQGLFWQSSH